MAFGVVGSKLRSGESSYIEFGLGLAFHWYDGSTAGAFDEDAEDAEDPLLDGGTKVQEVCGVEYKSRRDAEPELIINHESVRMMQREKFGVGENGLK